MAGCSGLQESIVLSRKTAWTEVDLRQVLILKDSRRGVVCYHSRECQGEGGREGEMMSSFCKRWFQSLDENKERETLSLGGIGSTDLLQETSAEITENEAETITEELNAEQERNSPAAQESVGKYQAARFTAVWRPSCWSSCCRRCKKTGDYICQFATCKKVLTGKKAFAKHLYLVHEGGREKRRQKKVKNYIFWKHKQEKGLNLKYFWLQICEHCGVLITANNMRQHVSLNKNVSNSIYLSL